MKKTLFTIGSTFIAASSARANLAQQVIADRSVIEVAQCESHIAEPNTPDVIGYDIRVYPQLLKIAALGSKTIGDAFIQPLEEIHWATEPAGKLVHSCFEENANHDTLEILVFEDVVVVQRTSLAGLHSPQVFKILRPTLNPEPHSRLNGTGSESYRESNVKFDFEKKVRHDIEYGEPLSPELLVSLKNQVTHLAQSQCGPTEIASQIGDFQTRSGQQPYMGEFIEVSGRFVCVNDGESDKFHVSGQASAWNADSGRLFETAHDRMVLHAELDCREKGNSALIISDPVYGGDNFSVATVSAWFTCIDEQLYR